MRILDLVEHLHPAGDEIVARVPSDGSGDFRLGSQLVVRENQAGAFFRDGKLADLFTAGRYTVQTNNVPILIGLLGMAFDGKSPFRAEVYFVNLKTFTDMRFGTQEPVVFRDKEFGMVRLRAFGTYTMRVDDPRTFLNQIVATQKLFETDQIKNFLRDVMISRLADLLGEKMETILDLPAVYDEIGQELKGRVQNDFKVIGLHLDNMYIGAITPPEEVQKAIDERTSMAAIGDMDKYMKFKAARGIEKAAEQEGGTAGAGVGMGAGLGMGMAMGGMIGGAMQGAQPGQGGAPAAGPAQPAGAAPAAGGAMAPCAKCQAPVPATSKFCPACGEKVTQATACPKCEKDVPPGSKFCINCGAPVAETKERPANCPHCGDPVMEGEKFCDKCGKPIEEKGEEG